MPRARTPVNPVVIATLEALPYALVPLALAWRARGSPQLADFPASAPHDAPLVTVVIPARNEAANIVPCLRSVLATTYPALEVVVVDDHSEDGTGGLAREVAAGDARVRVVDNPLLPAGWFGKQWACATGAAAARGALLCFTDADTRHAPELLARAVNALRAREAAMVSVGGRQELVGFWERAVQPQVFALLLARYGSAERVNRSPRVYDKIANGQFILTTRAAYDAVGGHAAVRDKVAEDLMLAQRYFAAGKRVVLVEGLDQLATRMYQSLGDIVRGWMKNIYAGSIHALPPVRAARALHPLLLLAAPAFLLLPPAVLLLAALGVGDRASHLAAAIAAGLTLAWWALVYAVIGLSPLYALAYPLGSAVLLYIMVAAIARGPRVAWKGREYVTT